MYRVANSGEPLTSKRKYVVTDPEEASTYFENADLLPDLDLSKGVSLYTYTPTRDLKIASGKKVFDYVLEKYGDTPVTLNSQFIDYTYKNTIRSIKTPMSEMTLKEAIDNYNKIYGTNKKSVTDRAITDWQIKKTVGELLDNNVDDVADYYAKKGYDGILDLNDLGNELTTPMIITKPVEKMKIKDQKILEYY
jgi:hypothetical protein